MTSYVLGFILGLFLVNVAVIAILYRRVAAADRRLAELEAMQEDWEPPDYMSSGDWRDVGLADLHSVLRSSANRHAAQQAWAQQAEEDAQEEGTR